MSAGVDQKPKSQRAQVQNGPVNTKEGVSDEDFERYMQTSQANQGYTAPNMAPAQDYLPSYYPSYSFQYSMPGSETTWSTGGDFNNFNYGTYDNSYAAENYYNQPGTTPPYLNQGLNFFPGNADFMTGSWSNSSAPGPQGQQPQQVTSRSQPAAQGTSYYDYARYPNASQQQVAPGGQRGYQGINGLDGHDGKAHGMKAVEQGMSGLNIGAAGDKQNAIGGVMTQNTHGMRSEQEMVRGQQVTTSSMAQQAPPPPASAPVTAAKPQSWAAIASKPAKPQPKMKTKTGSHAPVPTQLPPMKQTMTIGTWNGNDKQGAKPATTTAASVVQQPQVQQPPHSQSQSHGQGQGGQSNKQQEHGQGQQSGPPGQQQQQQQQQQHQNRAPQQSQQQQRNHGNPPNQHQQMQQRWSGSNNQGNSNSYANRSSGGGNSGNAGNGSSGASGMSAISVGQAIGGAAPQNSQPSPVLDKLRSTNTYNPNTFNLDIKNSRMFIIKSYSEDDIHRSIKYGIWCSTEHGNKRLDSAFRERTSKGPIYLLYSVNGSGHFCGVAEMMSVVDYNVNTGVWMQDKWKGRFDVRWVYVKDVPNSQLRHIRLENNDNKPVTNSRDTQEVPLDKGRQVLKIIHAYRHTTSIFDDFGHYEKRQEEDTARKPSGRDRRAQHRN